MDIEALKSQALSLRNNGRWINALELYQKISVELPEDWESWVGMGDTFLNMARWEDAVAAYQHSIKLKEEFDWAWHNLAFSQSQLSQWHEVFESHSSLLNLKPTFWEENADVALVRQHIDESLKYYSSQVNSYRQTSQFEKALEICDLLLQLLPNDANPYYLKGTILFDMAQYENAISSFNQALEIKPDFEEAWTSLISLFSKLERQDAVKDCCKATSEYGYDIAICQQILTTDVPEADTSKILGSSIASEFDREYYLQSNPDVANSDYDPLEHYIRHGWKELRNPNREFSTEYYLNTYHDVRDANIEPFGHYLKVGRQEGRQANSQVRDAIKSLFDPDFYSKKYGNLFGFDPLEHFIAFGWKLGYDPNENFSTHDYLQLNADIRDAGINPFFHYVIAGMQEQRLAKSIINRAIESRPHSPSILFIGHSAIKAGAEVVLLDMLRWYADHTTYQLKVILLKPGLLAGEYSRYAETLVLNNSDELSSNLAEDFLDENYDYIYLNTVVSGEFAATYEKFYAAKKIPIILHIHEMEKVIKEYEASFNKIKKYASLVIAASDRVKDVLVNKFDVSENLISVFHSFIKSTAVNRIEMSQRIIEARQLLGLHENTFVIMGAGTVYWRKGPDIFFEVADILTSKLAEYDIQFIWFGEGPDLDKYQEKAKEIGKQDKIKFLGFQNNANLLIAAANIFFLSSREDPFPLVCLEAAQYAIPIICFEEATGMSEFVADKAGICLNSIDIDIAVNALLELFNDSKNREILGYEARKLFLNSYESETKISEIFFGIRNRLDIQPAVSVIVPNYNHEKYIAERLESIVNQSIRDIEVIVLDDLSTDSSLEVINKYKSRYPYLLEIVPSQVQSGSPFKQWKKGLRLAKSEIVWIAESDDSCTLNLVNTLLEAFDDDNVVISYCKTDIINEYGKLVPGALDSYLSKAHASKFLKSYIKSGYIEVEENFGALCTIVNASSALFRRSAIAESDLEFASKFRMCGDWYVYLQVLAQGKISYSINSKNFFRRHSQSAVHKLEGTEQYFIERFKITRAVVDKFYLSDSAFQHALVEVDGEWQRFKAKEKSKSYEELYDKSILTKIHQSRNKRKFHVGFYVHGLLFSKGGIERLAADITNELVRRGHEVTIFCRVWGTKEPVYQLADEINIEPVFDENNIEATTVSMRRSLIKAELDVFVPMLSEWLFEPVIEAARGLPFPVIASEHNDPWKIEELWWNAERRQSTFEKVDKVHLLLDKFRDSLPETLQSKICVIPNGCHQPVFNQRNVNTQKNRIIGVGRLVKQKRFDRLIKGFALASQHVEDEWTLDIFGEGDERDSLEELIETLNLSDKVTLRGLSNNLQEEYSSSSIFVIPSDFEGFGIVVVEAKMAGLPTIGYSDCNGPNVIIRDNIDGILSQPDQDGSELSKALIHLMKDKAMRQSFSIAAKKDSERYDISKIVDSWEETLVEIVCHSSTLISSRIN